VRFLIKSMLLLSVVTVIWCTIEPLLQQLKSAGSDYSDANEEYENLRMKFGELDTEHEKQVRTDSYY
jgi:hypothetical protein